MSAAETRQRPDTTVTISLDVELILTHAEAWPDWDGEEELTAEAVAELVKSEGIRFLIDWGAFPEVEIDETHATVELRR